MELPKLMKVIGDKCVNCHQCISACVAKFANNASKEKVDVNENLCIGCGECIKACSHHARVVIDDFETFLQVIKKEEKIIAFCDPSVVSNFHLDFLHLNGWLKSLGVKAFFDVSFGAELAAKSIAEYLKERKPKLLIAQQCPVIVTYIQVYRPELIPYLAPVDSLVTHTMKMVHEFFPKYKDYKFLAISPCAAKKREFTETGIGDYNITIKSIQNYLDTNNINLSNFPIVDYSNPSAERAVLHSNSGGLTRTLERDYPELVTKTRIIENPKTIYKYLSGLHQLLDGEMAPSLVDCLNCDLGCNGGPGTNSQDKSRDELEFYIKKRATELRKHYYTEANDSFALKDLDKILSKYWVKGLYIRTYKNLSSNYIKNIKNPDERQLVKVMNSMNKFEPIHSKNCTSCGYDFCETMAFAVFNGLNKRENCRYFFQDEINDLNKLMEKMVKEKDKLLKEKDKTLDEQQQEIVEQSETMLKSIQKMRSIIE
jgi:iron only hydrogenase large subunit-like protein